VTLRHFLGFYYRNNLEYQTINRVRIHCINNGYHKNNIYHLKDDNALPQLKTGNGYYAFCVHSLHTIPDDYLIGKVVIIDEILSVLNALVTDINLVQNLYIQNYH
jgi:hypothetical protein